MEPGSIQQLLDAQLPARGNRPFLRFGERTLTFAEVDAAVRRLAAALQGLGIGPGDHVALILPNGIEFVVLWMACARLGALSVFVNPAYQGAMLEYVLDDSRPRALFVSSTGVQAFGAIPPAAMRHAEWVCVVDAAEGVHVPGSNRRVGWHDLLRCAEPAPPAVSDPGTRNCVIYTSGTTGPSKGAVLSNAALLAGSRTFVDLAELTEADVLFTPLPLFHGLASRQGVLGCLIAGAEVVIESRFSASGFWQQVTEANATVAQTMFNIPAMLKAQPPGAFERRHRLRFLYNAGHDDAFEARFGAPLLESYGLVETGITIFSPFSRRRPGSCGRLHGDWEARIVDPQGNELADGETGELLLRPRRPHLFMTGYLGKPEATLQACRDFWFHTGDFLYRDPDGFFYFAGRQKERIRRRGENISAWEIERIVAEHPAIRLCAAMGYPAEVGDDDVRLVVSVSEGADLQPAQLAAWLQQRMPPFMVPRYYEILDSLPLTPTKKVRKNELIEQGFKGRVWDREVAGWR
ncbi:MAG: AMP-binding protein [Lautropia sp.]